MNKLYKYLLGTMMLAGMAGFTACTDYLDKAPESDISETDPYKNFNNFQGFTEELYMCVPDFAKGYWTNSWNWGEDEILNVNCNYHMTYKVDQGDFWGWQSGYDGWQSGWMDRNDFDTNPDERFKKSLWRGAWYGIRKCNMGLANMDLLTDATQEEKNLIKGQLLFFRGWFHFQLIQYFGRLPYIDTVLSASETFSEPQLDYQPFADKVAADLRAAADLLPIDWDNTAAGRATLGKNQMRANKIMALGYLGKNYLWAGSPLMNKQSTGSASYNKDYCQKAASTFGELLQLVESGQTQYSLVDFADYSKLFYTNDGSGTLPGSTEAIFRAFSNSGWQNSAYGLGKQFTPMARNINGSEVIGEPGILTQPTANYVNYYGMANGLPLDAEGSGFDNTHPWKDRDPRFYHDIIYDGETVVQSDGTIANLYTDGSFRGQDTEGSRTGYLLYKFIPLNCNKIEQGWGWSPQLHIAVSYMRLADIYLMYAESVAEGNDNVNAKAVCDLSALDAINKIRQRAGVAEVDSRYTGSVDAFMQELRRERAVELAYEGHRFNDLRRWLLLDKAPYNKKTSQEFIRSGQFDEKNPQDNAVSGWSEKEILTRNFSEKHYWLPLKKSDVTIYPEFKQNPGWE